MKRTPALFCVVALGLLFLCFSLYADDRPLLAVPSIKATDVSQAEASACRNMVETALIKTESYNVLAYTDMEEILQAQEFSLSDCTDEACAVELGKMLAAEQIVVGELSGLGDQFVLNLRLIDVETGRSLGAELVKIESLQDLHDKSYTAAYALAGLKYIPGSDLAAREKGDLFVKAPENMVLEVYLNGIFKGKTPLLIEGVPFGSHILEARADDYEFKQNVTIKSTEIQELIADIAALMGNLFLSVQPSEASGYMITVDGEEKPPGLIRDLSIGERQLRISGGGWLFESEVLIEQDITLRTSVTLSEAGELKVIFPEGGEAEVVRDDVSYPLQTGEFRLLPAGSYLLKLLHPRYEAYEERIVVGHLDQKVVTAEMVPTEAYRDEVALAGLKDERTRIEKARKGMLVGSLVSAGVGVVTATVVGIMEALIAKGKDELDQSYLDYGAASEAEDAQALWASIEESRGKIGTQRTVETVCIIGAGVSLVTSPVLLLLRPSTEEVDLKIEEMEGGGQ